mmetsp:Transcript_4616/g.7689  ORF Transcript_4616/g.7689 Transcript_4616/m.7689 type:complete len:784 (+) Transcript_4616:80-2431(+)
MMASVDSTTRGGQAVAADPKAPSSFVLPSRNQTFDQFSAADGIGARAVETSTLLQILASTTSNKTSYRQVLYKCGQDWAESVEAEAETTDEAETSSSSFEALKLLYAVTHLTETHVLPKTPTMADTIVFLRQHCLDRIDLGPLLDDTRHPEEYPLYWTTLEALVLRGCTRDAWHLLSHHSACQRAFDNSNTNADANNHNNNSQQQRQQDQGGFLAFRALLESAPLPGGRTDYYDVTPADDDDDDDDDDTSDLLEGVGRLDYQLWKTNPMAAMASWRQWRRFGNDSAALQHLLHREPRLQRLFQIVQGDITGVECLSWSEALCAELLYVRPNLNVKTDLAIRMQQALQQQQGSSSSSITNTFEDVIISILQGDHGQVVEILFRLGGGSGAALPATMTSLMCNQLMADKLLPESARELQTQLLCSAADALLSSHAATNPDVGMRLAALLLVPHCSASTGHGLRITATLANAMEHHAPQQDAAAHALLELVRPLVETKKSRRILDGCVSVVVARYRHYYQPCAAGDYKKAMEWLVTGKAFEESLLSSLQDTNSASSSSGGGTCRGLMEQSSLEMSFGLLKLLVGADYATDSNTMAAQEMVIALRGQEQVDAVRLLTLVTAMAVATLGQQQDRTMVVAHSIAQCLASGTTSKNNSKGHHPLAPPSMHWDLLMLAKTILHEDEQRYESGPAANFESSFTAHDMHILMERQLHLDLVAVRSCEKDNGLNVVLAKGLMRAFLTENAQRKGASQHTTATSSSTSNNTLCSARIESYSPADQEMLVQSMLDF